MPTLRHFKQLLKAVHESLLTSNGQHIQENGKYVHTVGVPLYCHNVTAVEQYLPLIYSVPIHLWIYRFLNASHRLSAKTPSYKEIEMERDVIKTWGAASPNEIFKFQATNPFGSCRTLVHTRFYKSDRS